MAELKENLASKGPDYFPQNKFTDLFNYVKFGTPKIAGRLPDIKPMDKKSKSTNQSGVSLTSMPWQKDTSQPKLTAKNKTNLVSSEGINKVNYPTIAGKKNIKEFNDRESTDNKSRSSFESLNTESMQKKIKIKIPPKQLTSSEEENNYIKKNQKIHENTLENIFGDSDEEHETIKKKKEEQSNLIKKRTFNQMYGSGSEPGEEINFAKKQKIDENLKINRNVSQKSDTKERVTKNKNNIKEQIKKDGFTDRVISKVTNQKPIRQNLSSGNSSENDVNFEDRVRNQLVKKKEPLNKMGIISDSKDAARNKIAKTRISDTEILSEYNSNYKINSNIQITETQSSGQHKNYRKYVQEDEIVNYENNKKNETNRFSSAETPQMEKNRANPKNVSPQEKEMKKRVSNKYDHILKNKTAKTEIPGCPVKVKEESLENRNQSFVNKNERKSDHSNASEERLNDIWKQKKEMEKSIQKNFTQLSSVNSTTKNGFQTLKNEPNSPPKISALKTMLDLKIKKKPMVDQEGLKKDIKAPEKEVIQEWKRDRDNNAHTNTVLDLQKKSLDIQNLKKFKQTDDTALNKDNVKEAAFQNRSSLKPLLFVKKVENFSQSEQLVRKDSFVCRNKDPLALKKSNELNRLGETMTDTNSPPLKMTMNKSNVITNSTLVDQSIFDELETRKGTRNETKISINAIKIPKKVQNIENKIENNTRRESSELSDNNHKNKRKEGKSHKNKRRRSGSYSRERRRKRSNSRSRSRNRDKRDRQRDTQDSSDNEQTSYRKYQEKKRESEQLKNVQSKIGLESNNRQSLFNDSIPRCSSLENTTYSTDKVFNSFPKSYSETKLPLNIEKFSDLIKKKKEMQNIKDSHEDEMDISCEEDTVCEEKSITNIEIVKTKKTISNKADFYLDSEDESPSDSIKKQKSEPYFKLERIQVKNRNSNENKTYGNQMNDESKEDRKQLKFQNTDSDEKKFDATKKSQSESTSVTRVAIKDNKSFVVTPPCEYFKSKIPRNPTDIPFSKEKSSSPENCINNSLQKSNYSPEFVPYSESRHVDTPENDNSQIFDPQIYVKYEDRVKLMDDLMKIDDKNFYIELQRLICISFCNLESGLKLHNDSIGFEIPSISHSLARNMQCLVDTFYNQTENF